MTLFSAVRPILAFIIAGNCAEGTKNLVLRGIHTARRTAPRSAASNSEIETGAIRAAKSAPHSAARRRTARCCSHYARLQMSPPACLTVPRVPDLPNLGSVDTSPPTVGRPRWPDSTEYQNCWLRPSKFLCRWSLHHCGILCRLTWNSRLYLSHSFVAS